MFSHNLVETELFTFRGFKLGPTPLEQRLFDSYTRKMCLDVVQGFAFIIRYIISTQNILRNTWAITINRTGGNRVKLGLRSVSI